MAVMALEAAPAEIGEAAAGSEGSATAKSRAGNSIRGGAARGRSASSRTSTGPSKGSRTQPRLGGALAPKKGRTWAQAFDSMSGKTGGAPLLAEYIGGVVIICLGTLTQGPSKGYTNVMSELLLRLTALTTVFFVLFLLAGSKAGKAAVWFGLLVDLGIVFTAVNQNVLSDTATLISDTAVGGGTATLLSAGGGGDLEQPEPPPAVTLPTGTPETTAQTA
jgi:hypothetical protein